MFSLVLLLSTLFLGTDCLTAEELALFKPRIEGFIDPNTGGEAVVMAWDNGDGSQTVYTNGIPSHETGVYPEMGGNPHSILENHVNLTFNTVPVMRKEPMRCAPLEFIAVATSGTTVDSWFPAMETCMDVAEFEDLDLCGAHPSVAGQYHYHFYSPCVQMPVCGEPSPLYGVAIDGIPIYGPINEYGVQMTSEDLDECGGRYDRDGRYKYHVTKDSLYYMTCFMGEFRSDLGKPMDDFFCSCPYDDRMYNMEESFNKTTICEASDVGSEPLKCTDKEYLAELDYDIGYAWHRVPQNLTLAGCCPPGEDCGTTCKDNELCEFETRIVNYMTRYSTSDEDGSEESDSDDSDSGDGGCGGDGPPDFDGDMDFEGDMDSDGPPPDGDQMENIC